MAAKNARATGADIRIDAVGQASKTERLHAMSRRMISMQPLEQAMHRVVDIELQRFENAVHWQDRTAIAPYQTPKGEVGVKYTVQTKVQNVDEETIEVDGTVCQGDSGGPLINEEGEVFGVVSFGSAEGCGGGPSYYQRIDIWAQLILDAVKKSGFSPVTACSPASTRIFCVPGQSNHGLPSSSRRAPA